MSEPAPLEAEIRRLIASHGPMPVSRYMEICLTDPQYGYYVTRDPLGESGDFITAPEISQMFGELVGLWITAVWRQMGEPDKVRVIELGPGRGTLMMDAMRAASAVPAFIAAASIHLVEISPALRARQAHTLADLTKPPQWHDDLTDVPEGTAIVIANEFFDALPVHQAVKQSDGWHERMIDIVDGMFAYALAKETIPHFERMLPSRLRDAHDGEIFEWRNDRIAMDLGRRIGRSNSAALVIDYGHVQSAPGDTFQAAARHAYTDPLHTPGLADLTAHVDFEALSLGTEAMGAESYGPIPQGEWLRRLGIVERAKALKASANRTQRHEIDAALSRLTGNGRSSMGELFKVVAFADPRIGTPPGFET
jgi:SAM-dependent MidA family methyltransferase